MNAKTVLNRLSELGVTARAEGGNVLLNPGSKVPPELKDAVRENKPGILDLLAGNSGDLDHDPEWQPGDSTADLLAWAAEAAEAGLIISCPIHFLETPLRPYTTTEIGRYCRKQLKFLSLARSNKGTGGWGQFTPEWWSRMGEEAFSALGALKAAMENLEKQRGSRERVD